MQENQDLDGKLLQQTSVDYLNQINKNVVALNATASSQRDISERQLSIQDNTRTLIDEQKQTLAAKVQNQAYMAYGTVQHDMKNLMGVTDESARVAMTTMRIAGGNVFDDIKAVTGGAVDMASSGILKAQQLIGPKQSVDQGFFGGALGALGLSRAPNTMFNEDYVQASKDQMRDTFRSVGHSMIGWIPGFGEYKGKIDRERLLDFTAPYINRAKMVNGKYAQGGVYSRQQREDLGNAVLSIERDLVKNAGLGDDESRNLVTMAAQSESGKIRGSGQDTVENLAQNIRKFTEAAKDMGKVFGMTAEEMGRNLADLRNLTGFDPKEARSFMSRTRSAGRALGMNSQQSLTLGRQAVEVARNYGISESVALNKLVDESSIVRERASKDIDYKRFVYGQGGPEAVAMQDMASNRGFRENSLGLLYTMAKQSGLNVNSNTSLMDIQIAAAQTASGGPVALFKAKYNQVFGMGGEVEWQKNYYLNLFKQFPQYRNATLNDIRSGPKKEEFIGFLAFKLQTNDRKEIMAVYNRIFGMRSEGATSRLVEEGMRETDVKIQRDMETRQNSIGGRLDKTIDSIIFGKVGGTDISRDYGGNLSNAYGTPTISSGAVQNASNITQASSVTEPYGSTETVSSVSQEDKALADSMIKATKALSDSIQMLSDISHNLHSAWANSRN